MYTWGRGDDGRLGHGDNGWKYVPRVVEALEGQLIVQVRNKQHLFLRSMSTRSVSLTARKNGTEAFYVPVPVGGRLPSMGTPQNYYNDSVRIILVKHGKRGGGALVYPTATA